jgi:hypothetical protein
MKFAKPKQFEDLSLIVLQYIEAMFDLTEEILDFLETQEDFSEQASDDL